MINLYIHTGKPINPIVHTRDTSPVTWLELRFGSGYGSDVISIYIESLDKIEELAHDILKQVATERARHEQVPAA